MLSYPNWLRKYQESDEYIEAIESGCTSYYLYTLYKEALIEEAVEEMVNSMDFYE